MALRSWVRTFGKSRVVCAAFAGLIACASLAGAQPSLRALDTLPFGDGERLTFRIRASKLGSVGHAVMTLTGPVDVRGTSTMLASFDASAGIAFLKGSDATRSWIDLARMTSLRFQKSERRPFSSADDSVEIFPDLRHWDGTHGSSGTSISDRPLDELSFIYFLRTVTLVPDSVYSFDRHYDQRRLPTTVRIVKHDTLKTPLGEISTVEYEMRVVDQHNYKTSGLIYFWFSEDRCHLPVRIESAMPVLGNSIMTLETATSTNCHYTETK